MSKQHPAFDVTDCVSCGICAQACPVSAISMTCAGRQGKYRNVFPAVNETVCIGCGLCAKACPMDVIAMHAAEEQA